MDGHLTPQQQLKLGDILLDERVEEYRGYYLALARQLQSCEASFCFIKWLEKYPVVLFPDHSFVTVFSLIYWNFGRQAVITLANFFHSNASYGDHEPLTFNFLRRFLRDNCRKERGEEVQGILKKCSDSSKDKALRDKMKRLRDGVFAHYEQEQARCTFEEQIRISNDEIGRILSEALRRMNILRFDIEDILSIPCSTESVEKQCYIDEFFDGMAGLSLRSGRKLGQLRNEESGKVEFWKLRQR